MRPGRFSRFTWGLALLVAIAVAMRGLFLVEELRLPFLFHPVLDAAVYHRRASAWAHGLSFGGGPFYQSPGYPAFLSLVYRVAGPHPAAGVFANFALGVGTVVLTVLYGRRILSAGEGLLAGALLLTVGPLYYFEAQLLSTTLAVFLAALAVYAATVAATSPSGGAILGRRALVPLGAGVAAGALAAVRADLLPAGGVVILAWGVNAARRRQRWRTPLAYLVGFLIPLVPVTVHNAVHGALVPVATSGGINFYIGNFRGATGVYENVPGTSGAIDRQEAEADSLVTADLGHPLPPAAESRYWFRRALDDITADPFRWGKLASRKVELMVGRGEETTGGSYALERATVAVLRFAALPFNLLFALAAIGLRTEEWRLKGGNPAPRVGRGEFVPGAALALTVFAGLVAFFFMTRLRLPVVPVLAPLAAHALVRGRDAVRRGAWIPLATASSVIVVFTAFTWNSPLGAARNPAWEAELLTDASRAAEADGEAARAARVAPKDFAVHNNLGILLYQAGRWKECVETMHAAALLVPSAGSPWLYRGLALAEMGRRDEAASSLAAALTRAPSLRGGYVPLIRLLVDAGKTEDARSWADRAAAAGIALPDSLVRALPRPSR